MVSFPSWGRHSWRCTQTEGPVEGFLVERCFNLHIDGDGSWRHGAMKTRRLMRGDGLAQGGGAVWRRGGVDGS